MTAMDDRSQTRQSAALPPVPVDLGLLVDQVQQRYPNGIFGDQFIPFKHEGMDLEIRLFPDAIGPEARIGFFVPGTKYSRVEVIVDREGNVSSDCKSLIPAHDRRSVEPDFSKTPVEELALRGLKALLG